MTIASGSSSSSSTVVSDEASKESTTQDVKACNMRLTYPSGQKHKETFEQGAGTTLALVLTRVLERLPVEEHSLRFDLLYGYPSKPLSKRLVDIAAAADNSSGSSSSSSSSSRSSCDSSDSCGSGSIGSSDALFVQCLQTTVTALSMNNETVTVHFV
jgi:hypothetical protein